MGLILLLAIIVARLLVFFIGRHYHKPFQQGWLGAIAFGALTGMGFSFLLAPRYFFHDSPTHGLNPHLWLYFIPIFSLSVLAARILDRPDSRFIYFAIVWHFILIAYLLVVLVSRAF